MPQLTHHNFYSNFTASLKAGDLDLTNDILANEISDFIVFDTDKIVQALNKSDIKITKDNTDEQIVDSVIKNINTNSKLRSALAFIIAEGNEMLVSATDKAKQLTIISTISDGLLKVGKGISDNSEEFKTGTMDQIVSKAEKRKEYKRIIWNKDKKGVSGVAALLISLGVITGVVIIVYLIQRNAVAKSIPDMILGTQPAPMIPVPVVPVPPVPVAAAVQAVQPVQPIALLPEVATAPQMPV